MSKHGSYNVETVNGVEYVVVTCPQGHVLRGMKAGEVEIQQTITCLICRKTWSQLLPMTNGLEAEEG